MRKIIYEYHNRGERDRYSERWTPEHILELNSNDSSITIK